MGYAQLDPRLFADNIKRQINFRNTTNKQMSADLGISVNTLSNIAKGQDVLYSCIIRIADYLDCSLDSLLGRSVSSDLLTDTEQSMLLMFRKLSPVEQGQVLGFAHGLEQSHRSAN